MSTWIALFRGINVGGRNIVPMKELLRELDDLGFENARSYIQSGNVVFRSRARTPATLGKRIAAMVESKFGFRPEILVKSAADFDRAIAANPFPEAESDPRSLHLFFLAGPAHAADIRSLEAARASSEQFHLGEEIFYLHAPQGIGRSRLAARAEKFLGVTATGRNWRTVVRILELARAR